MVGGATAKSFSNCSWGSKSRRLVRGLPQTESKGFFPKPQKGESRDLAVSVPPKSDSADAAETCKESESSWDVDAIIEKLLKHRHSRAQRTITLKEEEVYGLIMRSREVFMSQSTLLELAAPIKMVGDIHGQYYDLLRIFDLCGDPPTANYLFLGDYVDRGTHSLETICLLLAYKIKYPENFFMLRGNHENKATNRMYGFYDDCRRRYDLKVWKAFNDTFNCMPLAAVIEDKIFCVHAGISPHLKSLKQIENVQRPLEIPDEGLVCDLLWSDPEDGIVGWQPSERGVSYVFGDDAVEAFLERFDLDIIVRAHQVVEDGYQFAANRRLITIFSAPNYAGEFDNAATVMSANEELLCSFHILKPRDIKRPRA